MEWTEKLRNITSGQHGLVTTAELQEVGLTRRALRHQVAAGYLEPAGGESFRLIGAPVTNEQNALAAVLDVPGGAAISHSSAAALWGVPGYRLAPFNVTALTRGMHQCDRVGVIHQPRYLTDDHLVVLKQIPVTNPLRTAFDNAAYLSFGRLERMVDNFWVRRLLSHEGLATGVEELAKRGRSGSKNMRLVLADRGPDYVPPESGLEHRFIQLCSKAGIDEMQRQVNLGGDSGWIGRVDFFNPFLKLVVEIDSDLYHTALVDQVADRARHEALVTAGFIVVRFTEFEIWHEPFKVIRQLQKINGAAGGNTF